MRTLSDMAYHFYQDQTLEADAAVLREGIVVCAPRYRFNGPTECLVCHEFDPDYCPHLRALQHAAN